jgi:hypothetical protein
MKKYIFLNLVLMNAFSLHSIYAIPFFPSTPLDRLTSSVTDYDIEQFRKILKNSYHFHFVNNAMSFDVDTSLLKKCEHKAIDTARLYEIVHEFQELKKTVNETKEKSRLEYICKGASSAAAGIILDVVALFFVQQGYNRWDKITEKGEEEIVAVCIGLPTLTSLPALYYAKGQLGKAWNYEENSKKLLAIERDLQEAARIINERAKNHADDDIKKVLEDFVREMSVASEQS